MRLPEIALLNPIRTYRIVYGKTLAVPLTSKYYSQMQEARYGTELNDPRTFNTYFDVWKKICLENLR